MAYSANVSFVAGPVMTSQTVGKRQWVFTVTESEPEPGSEFEISNSSPPLPVIGRVVLAQCALTNGGVGGAATVRPYIARVAGSTGGAGAITTIPGFISRADTRDSYVSVDNTIPFYISGGILYFSSQADVASGVGGQVTWLVVIEEGAAP